jgi:hypothetical protein
MNIDILTFQQRERASIEQDNQPANSRKKQERERERKKCRLVMVASGMWMRQDGNDEENYVKKNQQAK